MIPGSALKGAIRTAIVNKLAQHELVELKRLASDRQGSKKVQEKVLSYSRVNEDPMKFLKSVMLNISIATCRQKLCFP